MSVRRHLIHPFPIMLNLIQVVRIPAGGVEGGVHSGQITGPHRDKRNATTHTQLTLLN